MGLDLAGEDWGLTRLFPSSPGWGDSIWGIPDKSWGWRGWAAVSDAATLTPSWMVSKANAELNPTKTEQSTHGNLWESHFIRRRASWQRSSCPAGTSHVSCSLRVAWRRKGPSEVTAAGPPGWRVLSGYRQVWWKPPRCVRGKWPLSAQGDWQKEQINNYVQPSRGYALFHHICFVLPLTQQLQNMCTAELATGSLSIWHQNSIAGLLPDPLTFAGACRKAKSLRIVHVVIQTTSLTVERLYKNTESLYLWVLSKVPGYAKNSKAEPRKGGQWWDSLDWRWLVAGGLSLEAGRSWPWVWVSSGSCCSQSHRASLHSLLVLLTVPSTK